MKLFIIDAVGPFFQISPSEKNEKKNWSKIPFARLEEKWKQNPHLFSRIRADFQTFTHRVSSMGYNAITLDDLAHLIIFPFASYSQKQKIWWYRAEYQKLIRIAKAQGLKIFLTSDVMFFTPEMRQFLQRSGKTYIDLLKDALEQLFHDFSVDGVLFRIGESDGKDVSGDFLSELVIRTPEELNCFLKELLPVCELFQKHLILRTWTVGASTIGDLMWNRNTFERAFGDINSNAFVLSMKHGESDFFQFLRFSPFFQESRHQKILELQARREREGFGMFPFFTGWENERYIKKLKHCQNMLGISVWCQTGGWSRHHDITFLQCSSPWNELNTFSAVQMFRFGKTADECVKRFFHNPNILPFLQEFFVLFSEALYGKGDTSQTLYFRRLRLPPLLFVHWDRVLVTPLITHVYRSFLHHLFVEHTKDLSRLVQLGAHAHLRKTPFFAETLHLLFLCHGVLFGKISSKNVRRKAQIYEEKYPVAYSFDIQSSRARPPFFIRLFLRMVLRKKAHYRLWDHFLLLKPVSSALFFAFRKFLPRFANEQCMDIRTTVFR